MLSLEFVTHVCNRVWCVRGVAPLGVWLILAAVGGHFF